MSEVPPRSDGPGRGLQHRIRSQYRRRRNESNRAKFSRFCAKCGRNCLLILQNRPSIDRTCRVSAGVPHKLGPESAEFGPTSTGLGQRSADRYARSPPMLGRDRIRQFSSRNRATSPEIHRIGADFWENWGGIDQAGAPPQAAERHLLLMSAANWDSGLGVHGAYVC